MGGSFYYAELDVGVFGGFDAAAGCAAYGELLGAAYGALFGAEDEERGAAGVLGVAGHAVAVVLIEAVDVGAGAPCGAPGDARTDQDVGAALCDVLLGVSEGAGEVLAVERDDALVVVLAGGHGHYGHDVFEPLGCLGVGGTDGTAAVPADGYAAVTSLSQQCQPRREDGAGVVDGLEGVAGEGASADTVGDVVVAAAVACEEGDAVLGHALAKLEVEAGVEVAGVAVEEEDGVDRRGLGDVGRGRSTRR